MSRASTLVRPAGIRAGDAIAIVAPGSAPLDLSDLERGIARLEDLGFGVVQAFDMTDPPGYLADPDDRRVAYLNGILGRRDIGAVFCARGGYGSLRLLDAIDYGALRSYPRLIVGYSDITALHLAVLARTGIPGLSAAMVATDWGDIHPAEADSVIACLSGNSRVGIYGKNGLTLDPERSGAAEGRLIGGNLTILCRLIGTPYMPDLTGAILFVEEVGEQPYRIDGLFAQLKLAGILNQISGLVIGGITEAAPASGRPSLDLADVLQHYANYVSGPVATGLAYGHFQPKEPMPVGVRARLEVDEYGGTLQALETLVEPI